MAKHELPSPELLRQLLRYEPETGKLFWLPRDCTSRRFNSQYAGKEALYCINNKGYPHGSIMAHRYNAHVVIWAITHGAWPSGQIDHINGVKTDNRLVNLRHVSAAENQRNMKRPINNTSGIVGVGWCAGKRKWRASINVNDRTRHIGYFSDIADAATARKAAEVEYGYHPNHGR